MIDLSKKDRKRLHAYIGKTIGYWSEKPARDYYNQLKVNNNSYFERAEIQRVLNILEAHKIFNQYDFTEQERVVYWRKFQIERRRSHLEYKRMPSPPRKDNKDYISSGGSDPHSRYYGSYHPTIRYPKKVRKTAWKRFFRLFPFLKDKL